ncbi:hypothetical protein SynROS8604_01888 [Synechococcus sp. ROS8604]|nr:hypothetical protein SynROS8604_01888 [Synechococcus sp. ROS8604]
MCLVAYFFCSLRFCCLFRVLSVAGSIVMSLKLSDCLL